ncbi:MAG: metallophosphoesterase [Phycisphaeraceae bacterium]
MKLGIISDTHDRLPTFRRAVSLFQRLKVDAILHAGDYIAPFAARLIAPEVLSIPLHCIYGNNDGERKGLKAVLPNIVDGPLTIKLGGRTIVMHHFIDWLKPADYASADIIITGHTHHVVNETKDGKLFLNPGECCGWLTDRCTVALLDTDAMKADVVEVHE